MPANQAINMSVTNQETVVKINLNDLQNGQITDFFKWQNFSFAMNLNNNNKLVLHLLIPDYPEMQSLLHTLQDCIALIPVGHFDQLKINTNNILAETITRGFAISNHLQWIRG